MPKVEKVFIAFRVFYKIVKDNNTSITSEQIINARSPTDALEIVKRELSRERKKRFVRVIKILPPYPSKTVLAEWRMKPKKGPLKNYFFQIRGEAGEIIDTDTNEMSGTEPYDVILRLLDKLKNENDVFHIAVYTTAYSLLKDLLLDFKKEDPIEEWWKEE